MAGEFNFAIENADVIQAAFDRLAKATSDFRIPFRLIASDFYRSQKKLFSLQSAGLYPPLGGRNYRQIERNGRSRRANAEDRKERLTKHPWAPILYGVTGDLRDSTLSNSHKNSIFNLGKQDLAIGTNVPYGKYHQSDSPGRIMPYRKFVFIDGGPADRSKDANISGRRDRWLNIIETHLEQLLKGAI